MQILCYGAGAVGSLVGGRLALGTDAEVTLLARRAHVAAIRTRGLGIETPEGVAVCKHIDSITSLDDLRAAPDVVVLTVKAYQTAEALADLATVLRGGARVLSLQNGVGNEEEIAGVVGADRTVSGAVTLSVSTPRAGDVRQNTAGGGIALAPVRGGSRVNDLAVLLGRGGFRTEAYPDYRAVKWSKLLLNILANAGAAVLDMTPAEIAADPRSFAVERAAFLEAVRVMRGLGLTPVPLPGYPVPLLARVMAGPTALARIIVGRRLGGGRGSKMPSLWEDLQRGRDRSEVDVLNGAVVREGVRLGIPTPVNAAVTEALLALARGQRDRREFRRKPDALLA
jgi:2-dehydropantoate 2-reductase